MATATISLTGTLDGTTQTVTASATLDDSAMPYFFAFYRSIYGQIDSGTKDDNDNPVMRDMTDAETFAAYAKGIANGTVDNVQRYVTEQALAQAAAAVPTITATPVV